MNSLAKALNGRENHSQTPSPHSSHHPVSKVEERPSPVLEADHAPSPLSWGATFRQAAQVMLDDDRTQVNLKRATRTIRNKRQTRVEETPDWEELRDAGHAIKQYTLNHLPQLLIQLEKNVQALGGTVHWARDAEEANQIIHRIIAAKQVREVVKVKSMATQEIGLNEYLEERGIKPIETDLAELIVQLGDDKPSHIVVPAIHKGRAEIRGIFAEQMEGAPEDLSDAPEDLAEASRKYLRAKFLEAKVAISGANFMVADSGAISVVESEGNGRMCLTLPETLISLVGIEKVIPTFKDAEVFMQLLPRSATGERMNPYTSWWSGVTPGDGPQEFHLVLLDNGRSNVLADPVGRDALMCIRCGACMNVCPIYEIVGGHAYQSIYPGPIGAILTPQLMNAFEEGDPSAELPFASTLCGACFDVCPVKIDIPSILVDLRRQKVEAERSRGEGKAWGAAMAASSKVLSSGIRMAAAESLLPVGRALGGKKHQITALPWPVSSWTEYRDVPAPPEEPFRKWMKEHKRGQRP